ncbi:hypothetical protein [Spongiivirga citrea]|uniref:SdiA-regulated family protein n=1 Tax=Spongiivirga citrea TaxID=1481457 RepID=A0A6M0CM81_9FLAO|nr:hypothetical protein [Spongiivirga citrea]NER16929.1 hypothetical protein [Spongiivirga citrea]
MKNLITNLLSCLTFVGCTQDYGQLKYITKLPDVLEENSGISKISENGLFWFVNDSGNKDHLYGVNEKGQLIRDIKIKGAKNKDWEDLTKDEEGNIYIGDFGNNTNKRKTLSIYKIPNPELSENDELKSEKIEFSFPEQLNYPPKDKKLLFDVEAFFYLDNNLYLFTRNRSSKKHFDGTFLVYKVPAESGKHKATLLAKLKTCEQSKECQITSAAINPTTKKVVLLGYDRLWTIDNFNEKTIASATLNNIPLGHRSQKESVCFLDDTTILISDELYQLSGQNLYSFMLK